MNTSKVVVITGAAQGIGRATALAFAAEGYRVVLAGLDPQGLAQTAEQVRSQGAQALVQPTDLTQPAQREALFAATLEQFGRIDVLVNNAALLGVPAMAISLEETPQHFEAVLAVNLNAAFFCSQLAGRVMVAQGGGSIVNISSVGASAAQMNCAAYCASKAALEALTRSLALEWARYNIRVNAVAPGDVRTEASDQVLAASPDQLQGRFTPLGRQGTPGEIAQTILFVASEKASFMTGSVVLVDGGFLSY